MAGLWNSTVLPGGYRLPNPLPTAGGLFSSGCRGVGRVVPKPEKVLNGGDNHSKKTCFWEGSPMSSRLICRNL